MGSGRNYVTGTSALQWPIFGPVEVSTLLHLTGNHVLRYARTTLGSYSTAHPSCSRSLHTWRALGIRHFQWTASWICEVYMRLTELVCPYTTVIHHVYFLCRARYSLTMELIWTAARQSWETLQALGGNQGMGMGMEQVSAWTPRSGPCGWNMPSMTSSLGDFTLASVPMDRVGWSEPAPPRT